MARTGKIARLPWGLRRMVNEQLRDGKTGPEILGWLNENPHTLELVSPRYDGRSINEQSLSEWRAGGYQEWLQDAEIQESVIEMIGEAQDLELQAGDYNSLADSLSAPLAIELNRCLKEVTQSTELSGKDRRDAVLALVKASTQIRRANHARQRLTWNKQSEEYLEEVARQEKYEKEAKDRESARRWQQILAEQAAPPKAGPKDAGTAARVTPSFSETEAHPRGARPWGETSRNPAGPADAPGALRVNQAKSN